MRLSFLFCTCLCLEAEAADSCFLEVREWAEATEVLEDSAVDCLAAEELAADGKLYKSNLNIKQKVV